MPPTESRVKINGFAALDTAVGICSPAIKRSVAAPSPEFRCATSFYQRQICEKYLTVPGNSFRQTRFSSFFSAFSPIFPSGFEKASMPRHWPGHGRFSLSKNAYQARAEMGVLEYKREKNEKNAKKREGWLSLHFLFANFLRFMAANLSLTQLETWARPR